MEEKKEIGFFEEEILEIQPSILEKALSNRELKKIGVKKLKCVYSDEISVGEKIESEERRKSSPSSISFIPSAMGLIISSEVVKDLILWNK